MDEAPTAIVRSALGPILSVVQALVQTSSGQLLIFKQDRVLFPLVHRLHHSPRLHARGHTIAFSCPGPSLLLNFHVSCRF